MNYNGALLNLSLCERTAQLGVSMVTTAMEKNMSSISKMTIIAAAAMTLGVSSASADVVCNEEGDCWRVKERRTYEPSLKLRVYPDDWRWKEGERYRWREHGRGHGYWRNGVWIEIN